MATKKSKKKVAKKKKQVSAKRALLGTSSGVGIFATWSKIFKENEKKKLTDKQLMKIMEAEFPGRAAKSKVFCSVKTHRNFLNKGLHGFAKPRKKSVCYDH